MDARRVNYKRVNPALKNFREEGGRREWFPETPGDLNVRKRGHVALVENVRVSQVNRGLEKAVVRYHPGQVVPGAISSNV